MFVAQRKAARRRLSNSNPVDRGSRGQQCWLRLPTTGHEAKACQPNHLSVRIFDIPQATLAAKLFSSQLNELSGTIVTFDTIKHGGFASCSSSLRRRFA